MIDITNKSQSLRRAIAEAVVEVAPDTISALREGRVPKGDVAELTRATALLGVKRTPDLLPFCHHIQIHGAEVEMEIEDDRVIVRVEVAAIARTGVEVEAMTGAAIAALSVYDLVKPIDKTASIGSVRLVSKKGGKSDRRVGLAKAPRAGVLVVSDSVAAGEKSDRAGQAVREALEAAKVEVAEFKVLADEPEAIRELVAGWIDETGLDLAICVGGTGLGPRDRTPEALAPLIERELPGVMEQIRAHGRLRTPRADLGRGVAGQRGGSVILGIPGSTAGAREAMEAVMPWLLHAFEVRHSSFQHPESDPR